MELHFCNVCGVSIPQSEIDDGQAVGSDGKELCADHRAETAAASPATPPPIPGDGDLELLFCANCRVSIPATDHRSGRARKEYGSLLCGVCSKADPGERAARREAVESEMAADVEATDPIKHGRCSVCAAAVPQSHIVMGKALVSGDRTVCESCRTTSAASGGGGGVLKTLVVVLLVAAIAGGVGFGVGELIQGKAPEEGPDAIAELANVKSELEREIATLRRDVRDGRMGLRSEVTEANDTALDKMQNELEQVSNELAGMRSELAREDVRTGERLAVVETRLGDLAEMVKTLASRDPVVIETGGRSNDTGSDEGGDEPIVDAGGGDDDQPVVPEINAEVLRNTRMLLESEKDSERFPAANELGKLGDPAAIPALAYALIHDDHFLVRRACARSLADLKAWKASPYLIQALEDKEPYVGQQANFALHTITGQDFEVTQDQSVAERRRRARTAKKWWEKNENDPPQGVSLHDAELVQ